MNYKSLLAVLAGITLLYGCSKDTAPGYAGVEIAAGEAIDGGGFKKLLILNEGSFPSANSTLDVLDFSAKSYTTGAFAKANPNQLMGLGSTGNDIRMIEGNLWIAMNGSNQVHVVRPSDFKLISSIEVPNPRKIAYSNGTVFVTSYNGAVYGGSIQKGLLFTFNALDFSPMWDAETGCQPEGVGISGKYAFVANSGGFNYVHENTVTSYDIESGEQGSEIVVAGNLNELAVDSDGKVWVSSYGEATWTDDGTGNWVQHSSEPQSLHVIDGGMASQPGDVSSVHCNKMTLSSDGYIYAFGNDAEMSDGYDICLYKVSTSDGSVQKVRFADTEMSVVSYPYGILVNPSNGDIYIADASFTGPSRVYCFSKDYKLRWNVTSGTGSAHMLLI